MPPTTLYEIRIGEEDKLERRYAKNLIQLFSLLKELGPIRPQVHKVYKNSDGTILRSEKLDCQIKGKSFLIKIIPTKEVRPIPERPGHKVIPPTEEVIEKPLKREP